MCFFSSIFGNVPQGKVITKWQPGSQGQPPGPCVCLRPIGRHQHDMLIRLWTSFGVSNSCLIKKIARGQAKTKSLTHGYKLSQHFSSLLLPFFGLSFAYQGRETDPKVNAKINVYGLRIRQWRQVFQLPLAPSCWPKLLIHFKSFRLLTLNKIDSTPSGQHLNKKVDALTSKRSLTFQAVVVVFLHRLAT